MYMASDVDNGSNDCENSPNVVHGVAVDDEFDDSPNVAVEVAEVEMLSAL